MLVLGQRVATFALVCVGWVFFRADSMATAFSMLGRLVVGWTTGPELVNTLVVASIALMLGLQYAPNRPALVLQERISALQPAVMFPHASDHK